MPEAVSAPLGVLERTSKAATAASVFLIVLLQLVVHPDLTLALRSASVAALAAGWFAGRSRDARTHLVWVLLAPLAPALLRGFTGREGDVLDILWMAGLSGSLLRTSSWSRWNFPVSWRVLLGGWALTLSLAWPVFVAREAGFDLRGLQDAGAINSWAMRSAPQVVAWILYVVQTQLLGLLWLDWLMGRFSESSRPPAVVYGLWIGAAVASLVSVYQGTVDLSVMSTPAWAALGRATGTMLDANTFGVIAALAGPVAFITLRSQSAPWAYALGVAMLALNLAGMWMSSSRTALVCGLAGVAALAAATLREGRLFGSSRRAIAVAAAVIVVIVVAADAVGPWRRLGELPLNRQGLSLVWSRGPYGAIATKMIRDYPVTGVGVGSYHVLAPDYWRVTSNAALPWDNAQNWWRHQATELGLLGALPILAWSALLASRVMARRSRSDHVAATTVRGLLVGLGLISLLGMPTQNPVVVLWFFFLVAWLTTLTGAHGRDWPAAGRWTAIAAIVAMVTSVGYASSHAVLGQESLAVQERAQRTSRDFVWGAYEAEPLADGSEFRWTRRLARFVWVAKTRWLEVRVWATHPDLTQRPVTITVATPCQVLFDQEVRSPDRVGIGLELPEGLPAVSVSVRVSRTWQPSAQGAADTRVLGAAVSADFQDSRDAALQHMPVVELKNCAE